jgi:uncharacterized repeat protein (TIGR03803 family)
MKIRARRLCALILVAMLSLLGFSQAGAQDNNTSGQLNTSPQLRGETGIHEAQAAAPASRYEVLYSFCSLANCLDGAGSHAGLTQDAAGNLYGTTHGGGANANGQGTVFKVDTTGHETVLYSFCSQSNCADGQNPLAGLIQDAAGNLYGTTPTGGSFNGGTVFKVDTAGHETVLYSFCPASNSVSICLDGSFPQPSLIQDASGNLYGTTPFGGPSNPNCWMGCGTVFKVDTTGHESVLYNFCSALKCVDGVAPQSSVIQDAAGNLYGTAADNGAHLGGVVFKLHRSGRLTVLYSFCSAVKSDHCTDGAGPVGIIRDAAGSFYGVTSGGGTEGGGVAFKLDNARRATVLHSFCSPSNCKGGSSPSGLVRDAAGNLYGTTSAGGITNSSCLSGCGTVFKLTATGQYTLLHRFCSAGGTNCTDGANPAAGLIQDAAGNLYGTTVGGGATGGGVVFKFSTVGATVEAALPPL